MEIFYPVLLLMIHTIIIYMYMAYRRYTAVSKNPSTVEYYKLYVGEENEASRVVSRHVINLLEAPVLFYLGAIILFVTGQSGAMLMALAWAYVGLRLVHSVIHLGPNVVIWRFRVFVLSMFVLTVFLALVARGLFSAT